MTPSHDKSDDATEFDALSRLASPIKEGYRCVLGASAHGHAEHVALVLGSIIVKSRGDYEGVLLLTEAGNTSAAATVARNLVEGAVNVCYLSSLDCDAMAEEAWRYGLHNDLEAIRAELVQQELGKLRAAGQWIGPDDLDRRKEAAGRLAAQAHEKSDDPQVLAIVESWKQRYPTAWSATRRLADRLKAVRAEAPILSNLWIAYRLFYPSSSGFSHGPGSLGVITRPENQDPVGSRVKIGYTHTLRGHTTPLLVATLMSVEMLDRYSLTMSCGLEDSMRALRKLVVDTLPRPEGTEDW